MLASKLKYYIGPIVSVILSLPLFTPTLIVTAAPYYSISVFIIMCLIVAFIGFFYETIFTRFKFANFKKFALFSGTFWSILFIPIKCIYNELLYFILSYPLTNLTSTYIIVMFSSGFIFGIMFSIVYRYISAFAYS